MLKVQLIVPDAKEKKLHPNKPKLLPLSMKYNTIRVSIFDLNGTSFCFSASRTIRCISFQKLIIRAELKFKLGLENMASQSTEKLIFNIFRFLPKISLYLNSYKLPDTLFNLEISPFTIQVAIEWIWRNAFSYSKLEFVSN